MADSPSSLIKPTKSNARKSCSDFNILSPRLKEPFKKGWRREVVYRAVVDNERRNMCDIYYFSPDGKKLRSGREVSAYLDKTKSSFSLENFTFWKEPIGMDVKHEVLRFARPMARRNVGASENASPKKNLIVRPHRVRVLQRSDQKDDDEVTVVEAAKETTPEPSSPVTDNHKTSSKNNHSKRRNTRCSASKQSPNKMKLQSQPPKKKLKLPSSLHSSSCKSDGDYTSTQNDDKQLESPSGEDNVVSPIQHSPALSQELPQPLPETLPLNSPLIALLPLGTTLVLSDSQTVRIIPSNPNSVSTPVKENETISPKVSLPPLPSRSVVTDISSATSLNPDAAVSLNSVKFNKNVSSIPCSALIRQILSPERDGFAVPSCPSTYEDQIPLVPFGTVNRKRSYWASIGQAIIEEGLQKALLSYSCQINRSIKKNPVRVTRKKREGKKSRDVRRPPSPTDSAVLTCKDYFAFRKERRQQQLNSQSSVPASRSAIC